MAIFSSYAKWSRKILYPFDIINESVYQEYDLAFDLFGNVLIGLKLINIGGVLFLGIAFPVSLQSHAWETNRKAFQKEEIFTHVMWITA